MSLAKAQPEEDAVGPDWQAAIARHQRRVLVALLARGLSLADAQDAAQAAWERLIHRSRHGALPHIELPGLAIRQALFLHASKSRADRRLPVDALPITDRQTAPALEPRVLAADELRTMLEALKDLSPRAQQVFRLAYGPRALSCEEIAREEGISTQRAKQILCEVRAHLRRFREEPP